jgi:hypothetical protein
MLIRVSVPELVRSNPYEDSESCRKPSDVEYGLFAGILQALGTSGRLSYRLCTAEVGGVESPRFHYKERP